jgi:hypothetical protein
MAIQHKNIEVQKPSSPKLSVQVGEVRDKLDRMQRNLDEVE